MRRLLIGLSAAVVICLATGTVGLAQTKPEYRLGFETLAEMIPDRVGEPLENEQHAANGDALQSTTKGLMVWRKADNWTAFTDGATTWVNGPFGLQSRPNNERFPWEGGGPQTLSGQTPTPLVASSSDSEISRLATFNHLGPDGKPLQISGVAFSPDGRWLASAGFDPTFEEDPSVKLWDVATGRELRTLSGNKGWILGVAVSPDGHTVASAGSDGEIILWDSETGEQLRTMKWPDWIWADSVSFSPDGQLVASGGSNGTVELWDAATGKLTRTLGQTDWTWEFGVAFSPDGHFLAAGSWDGNVALWDLTTNSRVKSFNHPWQVHEVAFSPDGRLLATGSRLGTVKLWDVASGNEVNSLTLDKKVNSISFSPDGRLLAVGLASDPGGKAVYLWDVTSGRTVALDGQKLWSNSVAFSPHGDMLASGGAGGDVMLWGIR